MHNQILTSAAMYISTIEYITRASNNF